MKKFKEAVRRLFVENAGLKLIALIFAVVLFFIAREQTIREVEIEVPLVATSLPAQRILVSQPPGIVRVRIRGHAQHLTEVLARRTPFELDLSDVEGNKTIYLLPETLENHLGEGVKVLSISPSNFTLEFDTMVKKSVPVMVDILHGPGTYYKVIRERMTVEPGQVELRGPSNSLERIKQVHTESLNLSNSTKDFTGRVALESIDGIKTAPSSVQVSIPIVEKTGAKLISGARMVARNCPAGLTCQVTPAFFQARVEGKERMVDQVTRENISHYVFIDISRLSIPAEVVQKDILAVEPVVELLKGAEVVLPGPKYFNVTVKRR